MTTSLGWWHVMIQMRAPSGMPPTVHLLMMGNLLRHWHGRRLLNSKNVSTSSILMKIDDRSGHLADVHTFRGGVSSLLLLLLSC